MKATVEKISSNKVKISFEIEAEKFSEGLDAAYRKNVKRINIPGFRKGKAPLKVIEAHYGPSVFYEDAFDEIFPEIYEKVVDENKLNVVDRPSIDFTQIERGKDLIFTCEVFVTPDVTLGDYKGIEVVKVEPTLDAEAVEREINRARENAARMIEVERPAEKGDTVVIDYAGFDGDNQFAGGTAKGQELVLGSGHFIPGFEDQLVGATVGQDVDVNVTFPEAYHEKSLAGKPVVFHVHVNGIREKEVPALDDEFAKDMGFDTLDEYKADVKANLIKRNEERAETAFENEVVEKAVATCEMDIPNGMVEEAIDNMLRDMEMRLMYQGMRLDDYLKYTGQTREDLRKVYHDEAERRVRTQLTLEEIRKVEEIKAEEADIDEEMKSLAEQSRKSLEDFKASLTENDKKYFEEVASLTKTIKFLKDNAGKAE